MKVLNIYLFARINNFSNILQLVIDVFGFTNGQIFVVEGFDSLEVVHSASGLTGCVVAGTFSKLIISISKWSVHIIQSTGTAASGTV